METQEHLDTFGNQTLLTDNVRKVGTSLEVVVKSQDICYFWRSRTFNEKSRKYSEVKTKL